MTCRSYLFVPADSERKIAKSTETGADALILDLEDSVAPDDKPRARELVADFLTRPVAPMRLVRVNSIGSGETEKDVAATAPQDPDGYVLPKCEGPDDIATLSRIIENHRGSARIVIMAIATETARAVRRLMREDWSHPRLFAMTWGGEDLAASLGALQNRDASGEYLDPFRMARNLTLYAAVEAGVAPIDAVFTNFRDADRLKQEARAASALGFIGKMAIHPSQIPVINTAFTPTDAEVEWAHKVVEIFSNADRGVARLAGEMLDAPHLKRAKNILGRFERRGGK